MGAGATGWDIAGSTVVVACIAAAARGAAPARTLAHARTPFTTQLELVLPDRATVFPAHVWEDTRTPMLPDAADSAGPATLGTVPQRAQHTATG
eukprot:gene28741-15258_t